MSSSPSRSSTFLLNPPPCTSSSQNSVLPAPVALRSSHLRLSRRNPCSIKPILPLTSSRARRTSSPSTLSVSMANSCSTTLSSPSSSTVTDGEQDQNGALIGKVHPLALRSAIRGSWHSNPTSSSSETSR